MRYRLTCKYTDNSTYMDPRVYMKLFEKGVHPAHAEWNIPYAARSISLALVQAQEWMDKNVRNVPCTVEEATERRLDTSKADEFIVRMGAGIRNIPQSSDRGA